MKLSIQLEMDQEVSAETLVAAVEIMDRNARDHPRCPVVNSREENLEPRVVTLLSPAADEIVVALKRFD